MLQQSALDDVDSFCSPERQFALLDLLLDLYHQGRDLIGKGVPVQRLLQLPVLGRARRAKSVYSNGQMDGLKAFAAEMRDAFQPLSLEYAGSREGSA